MAEDRDYRQTPLERLVPAVGPAEFKAGAQGRLVALAGGSMALPAVRAGRRADHARGRGGYVKIAASEVEIQRPLGMPDQGRGFLASCRFPDMAVMRVGGAVCVPGGVVLKDDAVLLESFSAPWKAYQHRYMTRHAGKWRLAPDRHAASTDMPIVDGALLWMDNQHLMWFGHFMLDLLTHAWAFEFCKSFLQMHDLKVACSQPVPAFGTQMLHAAGLGTSDLVLFDRPIACRDLIVATKAFQIQHYTSPPAIRLWEAMCGRAGPVAVPDLRVYVSRRANPTRTLAEEEEVERFFASRGFLVVYPETMSVPDQIALFSRSLLIAGCSGSNMFNIAYARRARSAFILVSPLLVHHQEHFLAAGSPIALEYYVGRVAPEELAARPGYVHCTWHVDLDVLVPRAEAWIRENVARAAS